VYFLSVAEASAAELYGPKQADLLDALGKEHDNFRAALASTMEAGELPTALRMGGALWRFWQMRGHLREAAGRLASMVEHPDAERDPAALAMGMEGAGGINYWMANWERAERYYTRCVDLRRSIGDRAGLGEALYNLSFVYSITTPPIRDLARARGLIDEALAAYREVDDARGMAKALWAIANDHQMRQEWLASRDSAFEALKLFEDLEDRFGAAWAYRDIGVAATYLQDFEKAEWALFEGLKLFNAAGDLTGMGVLVGDISILEGFRGGHERAARLRGAAFGIDRRSGQDMVRQLDLVLPRVEETVQGPLSQTEFNRLLEEGQSMAPDEAVALALRRDLEDSGVV
jgi:tetratricopeptide (TPR) repeat protein